MCNTTGFGFVARRHSLLRTSSALQRRWRMAGCVGGETQLKFAEAELIFYLQYA